MEKKYTYLIAIFLIIVTFIAYGQIIGNDFINFDDEAYIIENSHIKSGINPQSIKWAFSTVFSGNWHPLTWLSHMLDWGLFKDCAGGHHLINLLLHIGSVLFLFLFFHKTTKLLWSSAFVAVLFALHPLRVESVAWAFERKDVLSMFFGLACIYTYASYVENYKLSKYLFCLILFACGLMTKPMLVTIPFILLLLDYWPFDRWAKDSNHNNLTGRLIGEKIPFVVLTIASSIMTIWAQKNVGAVSSIELLPFSMRVDNAIISYTAYLGKMLWPFNLTVFYPYDFSIPLWKVLSSGIILIAITATVSCYIRKRPFLFVGWFWYLGTLMPVIGLVQVGEQAMADRYTYLPSIGIAIMLVFGIPLIFSRVNIRKKILYPVGIAILIFLTVLTWRQCGYWKNSITLWTHNLHIIKDNAFAYNNRGTAYDKLGQHRFAVEDYNEAIRLKPGYADAYCNRGYAYFALGQQRRAIEDYNEAIRLKPDYAYAYSNRGIAYAALGEERRAIGDYSEAIRLKPDYAYAYGNRGVVYAALRQHQYAINDYNEAIRLKSDYADAYYNRGNTYALIGQHQRAIEDYSKAIRLKPDYAVAYYNRGNVSIDHGQYRQAIEDYSEAIQRKPNYADAYYNRGNAYLNQGNIILGCFDAQRACDLGICGLLEIAKRKGDCR